MSGKPSRELGERAVSLLATSFVVLAGAAACLFIVVAFGEEPGTAVGVYVACFCAIVALLWLLRDKPARTVAQKYFWFCRPRKKRVAFHLEPKVTRPSANANAPGPPTVETLRELSGGLNTWVPSDLPPVRNRRGD